MASTKTIPLVGLGTWLSDNEEELDRALETALELGYRHIDTAWIYKNEKVVGRVVKRWLDSGRVTRKELFIVTKLPICGIHPEKVDQFLSLSLQNLGLDYVDLYLIHVPFGLDSSSENDPIPIRNGKVVLDSKTKLEAVWASMETTVRNGKAASIGLSNCDSSQIERIVRVAKVPPACLQVEGHVYFQQKELRATCATHGISVCAYSPLGSPGRGDFYQNFGRTFNPLGLLTDPIVVRIAKKHGKSPAQACLRFFVQQGIAVIPKSVNAQRLKENLQILDFELDSQDMKDLEGLDKGASGRSLKFDFLPGIEDHPEFPKDMR